MIIYEENMNETTVIIGGAILCAVLFKNKASGAISGAVEAKLVYSLSELLDNLFEFK